MDWMAKRREQIRVAMRLEEVLGENYKVQHDVCESGLTYIYFKGKMVKRVSNEEMRSDLNVYDYTVTMQWLWENGFDMYGNRRNVI